MADEQEQSQQAQPQDFGGYGSLQELVKAKNASGEEAKRWKTAAEQALNELRGLAQNARTEVQSRQTGPFDRLEQEYGVPGSLLRDAVQAEARTLLRQELMPLQQGLNARGQLIAQYQDYNKYEADVAQYINSDPSLQQQYDMMFQANPVGAMEYAYLKYGDARRRQVGQDPQPKEPERQAAAAQAQIPTQRGADSRNPQAGEQEDLSRAWEHYQKTKNPAAYVKARLRRVIPDSFLNQ